MMFEGCIGCVGGHNFAMDDFYTGTPIGTAPDWQQASSYHHSVGDAFILWEGNQGIGMTSDAIHGTSNFFTAFRNCWSGRDPAGGSSAGKRQQTSAVILYTYNRYYNLIGNVLGTPGYHSIYETAAASAADSGEVRNANAAVFVLGYSDDEGTHGKLPNDPLTVAGLMRWGNYDSVTGSAQWNVTEIPTGLTHYANAIPGTQALSASFYLYTKPAWWGSSHWPSIGPDVTDGVGIGGHAHDIPAAQCYANSPIDAAYGGREIKMFNPTVCYPGFER